MKSIITHKSLYTRPDKFKGWKFPIGSVVKVRRKSTPNSLKTVTDPNLDLTFAKVLNFSQDTVRILTIEHETYSVPYDTIQRTKHTNSPKFRSLKQIDSYVKKIIKKYSEFHLDGITYTIGGFYTVLYDLTRPSDYGAIIGSCESGAHTITLSVPMLQLMDKFDIKDTVVHEVGHALTMDLEAEEHGPIWKKVTRAMGGTGKEQNTVFDLHKEVRRNDIIWDQLCGEHEEFDVALPRKDYDKLYSRVKHIIERDLEPIATEPYMVQDCADGLAKMLLTMSRYTSAVLKSNRNYQKSLKEGVYSLNQILTFYIKESNMRKSDPRVRRVNVIRREINNRLDS